MFNRALFEENEKFIIDTLNEHRIDSSAFQIRDNYPIIIYHLTKLTTDRYAMGEKFYAISILTIAQALSANRSSYEAIGVYYEALHLPFFRKELKYRFAIYLNLLELSIRKNDLFFIELYMNKLRKYTFAIANDEELELLYEYLCLRIEIVNNPELNSSQLRTMNHLLERSEHGVSLTKLEVNMYVEELLGDYLFIVGDYEDSLQHHSQAFAKAKSLKEHYAVSELTKKLSITYDKMKNTVLALDLYKKHYHSLQLQTKLNRLNIEDYMLEIHELPYDERTAAMIMLRNAHLDSFSVIDRLTNTHIQTYFETQLSLLKDSTNAHSETAAILYVDVDWFKNYNDHYGHIKGDQVLQELGFTLRNSINLQTSMIARVSGDQFAIMLRDTTKEDAVINAKQILANVRKLDIEHRVHKNINILTVSIGVSYGKMDQLLHLYDSAHKGSKVAKKNGRNRVVYHTEKGSEK